MKIFNFLSTICTNINFVSEESLIFADFKDIGFWIWIKTSQAEECKMFSCFSLKYMDLNYKSFMHW